MTTTGKQHGERGREREIGTKKHEQNPLESSLDLPLLNIGEYSNGIGPPACLVLTMAIIG